MSMVVPAAKGTTTVIIRQGYGPCAAAAVHAAIAAASMTVANFTGFITLLPSTGATPPRAVRFSAKAHASAASEQNDRSHRRRLRADDVERKADERDAVLGDAIQILEVGHGDDAVFAQRPRIVEHARCAGFVIAVVEVITDDHDALPDAPLG